MTATEIVALFDPKKTPTWILADALADSGLDDDATLMRDYGLWVGQIPKAMSGCVGLWWWLNPKRQQYPVRTFNDRGVHYSRPADGTTRYQLQGRHVTTYWDTAETPQQAAILNLEEVCRRWLCWMCERSRLGSTRWRISPNHVIPVCKRCGESITYAVGRRSMFGDKE